MQKRILVVGSANMDVLIEIPRMASAGETILGHRYSYAEGGKGANAAVAAARQGAAVTMAAKIGRDDNGARIFENFQKEGICTDAVVRTDQAQTGFAVCTVEDTGENRIIAFAGANMQLDFVRDVPDAIKQASFDAVMSQFEVPFATVVAMTKWASGRGIPVIIDAGPAMQAPVEQLVGVTIFSPNETETTALTGMPVGTLAEAEAAAKALYARVAPQFVVIKMGGRGCLIYDGSAAAHVPPFQVTPVDPTAAGDAFTGALTLEYLRCGDIVQAARYANVVGALTTTRLGAMPSLPRQDEVQAFIEKNNITL
nr:ribokinase [Maliibacterium massiliense]